MKIWLVRATAALLLAWAFAGCGYNRLQELEENVFAAWEELDAGLQRKADLADSLLTVAKVRASLASRVIEEMAAASAAASACQISVNELATPPVMLRLQQTQEALSAALTGLREYAADHPQLSTDPVVSDLLHRIAANEAQLRESRRRYNLEAERFNAAIRKFPLNLTNGFLLRLKPKEHYPVEAEAGVAP